MNRLRDGVGRIQLQPRVGEISHCAHKYVIPGEQIWSRFGGGDREARNGNKIQIALLNIQPGREGGIKAAMHAL